MAEDAEALTVEQSPNAVSAEMYHRVFVGHAEGVRVLEDLVARFHDIAMYAPGGIEGQRETEKRAAQKDVIGFILRRIGQVAEGR